MVNKKKPLKGLLTAGLLPGSGVLDWINSEDIPKDVLDFDFDFDPKVNASFYNDLNSLKGKLIKALRKTSLKQRKKRYFITLFLGLVFYFLEDQVAGNNNSQALKYLNRAIPLTKHIIKDSDTKMAFKNILISVKHRLTRLEKLLILVSKDLPIPDYLEPVKQNYKKYVDVERVSTFTELKFKKALREYDQLFIIAHGDKSGTFLGDLKITPGWITRSLKMKRLNLSVLGIFSCQENLSRSRVKDNVDYFITDTISSVPRFNEMFIYAYVHNYLKTFRVTDSFGVGELGPVFKASSDVKLELYEGGKLLHNKL